MYTNTANGGQLFGTSVYPILHLLVMVVSHRIIQSSFRSCHISPSLAWFEILSSYLDIFYLPNNAVRNVYTLFPAIALEHFVI